MAAPANPSGKRVRNRRLFSTVPTILRQLSRRAAFARDRLSSRARRAGTHQRCLLLCPYSQSDVLLDMAKVLDRPGGRAIPTGGATTPTHPPADQSISPALARVHFFTGT
jgi:hypothetical protein